MALRLADIVGRSEPEHAAPPSPAADALKALRAQVKGLQDQDAAWASKEHAEVEHVRACGSAQAELATLEQRRIDGIADQEVTGQSNIDTDALASEIATKREHAEALIERARLAAAKIIRIRTQRAALREQQAALQERFRPAQHAARMQALGMAMPALIAAERQYVQALTKAFAAAAAADELARAPGPQLGFAGLLPIADLLLPRPVHPTYKDIPSPQRPDISAAVTSEAERLVKELS